MKMIKKMKCWDCGKDIEVVVAEYHNPHNLNVYDKEWNNRKNLNRREFCTECKRKHNSNLKEIQREHLKLGAQLKTERAIRIIEQQNMDAYEYREAIEAVSECYMENPERFRSSEEVVATIVLIHHEIKVKNNYKVGQYIADIYVPSLTCIVEIDGYMHNSKEAALKDGNKDNYIRRLLGSEWEVVRIPTKFINENAENLVSAIIELKANMMKLREENGGYLPYNFSKTQNAVYDKVLKRKG
jgi:very-short-patch-repair endonuclease